ncbi:MAG: cytochrome c biogenesis protein [Candidatus Altarchaeaceae archaeon]
MKKINHKRIVGILVILAFLLIQLNFADYSGCPLNETCKINTSEIQIQCPTENITNITKKFCVYFFYSNTCSYCKKIEPFIYETIKRHPLAELKSYEISNYSNREKLMRFFENYGVKENERFVPAVFIGDTVLIGEEKIRKNLEEKIIYYEDPSHQCPCPENYTIYTGKGIQHTELTLLTIIFGGLIDSINPCAIGVLIIFISFLLHKNLPKRKILKFGSIYISCVYIAYLLAGIGILSFLSSIINLFYIIQIFVIALLLIFSALSFYDAYKVYKNKNPVLAIPKGAKGILEKYISKYTLFSVIILGFIVALVELPCSGAIYFGILDLLAISTTFYKGILYLLLYNFLFVLPLIIILFLFLKGKEIELFKKSETFTAKYIMGTFILILAFIIIYSTFQIPKLKIDLKIPEIYWFFISILLYTFLFFIFAILKNFLKNILNLKFYCAVCYSVTILWSILAFLFLFNVEIPEILLSGLIGMSIVGIWTEMHKIYKNKNMFWVFHIFWINFAILIFYSIFSKNFEIFFISLIIIYATDIYLMLIYKEVKEEIKEEKDIKGKEKIEKENLKERLKHCCG